MRRIFLLLLLFVSTIVLGQTNFRYKKCFNNYWDDKWEEAYHRYGYVTDYSSGYVLKGTYDNFVIYSYSATSGGRPADYIAKIKVTGLRTNIDKKERKIRKKNNEWYEYSGTLEYYSNEFNTTMELWLRQFPYVPNANRDNTSRHVIPVTIKIAPFKKNPEVYSISLGNWMALGIQIL